VIDWFTIMNVEDFLKRDLNRRQFLGRSAQNAAGVAAGMVGLAGAAVLAQGSAAEHVPVAVVGVRNQGKALASGFASLPNANVVTLCDIDENVLPAAVQAVQTAQGTTPRIERDFRSVLDDPRVAAVVIATPDHWHARMTTLACEAGKDVYVETPVCHRGGEAAAMIAAARKHQRIVAVGLPQRSGAHFQSAIRLVQSGQLGKVTLAKAWFVQRRQPLTSSVSSEPPVGVDFPSWLGPAPQRAFLSNRFHYHWRWFWDHGTGELGAWGSQLLDVARWGLEVAWPQRVCATSGQRVIVDEAETPDALQVQFDCGDKTVIWEHRTWSNHAPEGRTAAVAFYGERGTLVVDRGGWKVYDSKEPLASDASELAVPHLADFILAVQERRVPIADLATGTVSAGWGQLAAISHRLGRELTINANGQPASDDALALWRPVSGEAV
jgi:predicted dehydrogenase